MSIVTVSPLMRQPTFSELDLCKNYIRSVLKRENDIGIFEFGVNAYWKDNKLINYRNHNYSSKSTWSYTNLSLGRIHEDIRLDAIMINVERQHIRGFEFKTSRNDFKSDNKWHKYLKYCNTFTFVCPEGVINKNELPNGIGLVYVSPDGRSWMIEKVNFAWMKRPKSREVDKEVYLKMIESMLQKAKFRQGDIL